MSSESLHEAPEQLSEETKNLHRAVVSLMEELEAVDWYQQRAEACTDPELVEILRHNRDEEIEHAMMVLEWLRRRHPKFDEEARTYLFKSGSITQLEAASMASAGAEAETPAQETAVGSLGIGSLKEAT